VTYGLKGLALEEERWKAGRAYQENEMRPGGSEIPDSCNMHYGNGETTRRTFVWPPSAKQLVIDCRRRTMSVGERSRSDKEQLISKLVEISGNPRDACLRFLRRLGVTEKRSYRGWTTREQQRLIELIEDVTVEEAARILRRPPASVRSMLHRLGLGARQNREWFTVSLLAKALHISRDEVRKWVDRGWLPCRVVQAQSIKVKIIDADDFCFFVKEHGRRVVGNRLSHEGLSFVRDYVFPRPHAGLLSVRGPYKKQPNEVSESDTSAKNACGEDLIDQSA